MDSGTNAQTVAQAVQAATAAAAQQAQSSPLHQHQSHHASSPGLSGGTAADNLTCQWQGCGERCDSAESLYDHVCERHVGRKSTNNLNLTCQWGVCRTTTVKRDHITSHIRVHVPLKPHKCDSCGKAFKRPQDLKKHVKTHADDSVLMTSPSHAANARSAMAAAALSSQAGKPFSAAAAGGYYGGHDNALVNPYPSYQPITNGNAAAYNTTQANAQYAGYGSVSYPNSTGAMQDIHSIDTRRRAIEALNDFLGDIKRRAIDPATYYDVGQRLQSSTLPLPVGTGYNTGYNTSAAGTNGYNYNVGMLDAFSNGMGAGAPAMSHGAMASHVYSLPLPNARTKSDLQDIDRFLEQLSATVYETSHGGIPHANSANFDFHTFGNLAGHPRDASNSPSSMDDCSMGGSSAIGSLPGLNVSHGGISTPALTPASISSYESAGQSPLSSHGRGSLGSAAAMYPTLPTVPSASHLGAEYSNSTSASPSDLAYRMDDFSRYNPSNHLKRQREVPRSSDVDMADAADDADDGSRTPKASDATRAKAKDGASPNIDPMLTAVPDAASESSPAKAESDASTPSADKRLDSNVNEQWVENIRVIEALREYITRRLQNGEFEPAPGEKTESEAADSKDSSEAANNAKETETKIETENETEHEGMDLSSVSENDDAKSVEIAKLVERSLAEVAGKHISAEDVNSHMEDAKDEQPSATAEAEDVKYPTLPS